MDAPVTVPRNVVPSVVFLRSEVPAEHPSTAMLGTERLGTGVAVAADRVLTAHYLVLGASTVEVTGFDGRPRPVRRTLIDHESGLAVLILEGPPLRPARIERRAAPGAARLPHVLHAGAGAQGHHRPRHAHRPFRGLLGVHAGPGDHHHRHQSRAWRGRRCSIPRGRCSAWCRWA